MQFLHFEFESHFLDKFGQVWTSLNKLKISYLRNQLSLTWIDYHSVNHTEGGCIWFILNFKLTFKTSLDKFEKVWMSLNEFEQVWSSLNKLKILYLRNRTWVTWVWHYLTIINLCWRNRWGLQFVHFEFEISRHFLGYPGFLIRGYPSHRGPIFENVPSCQG